MIDLGFPSINGLRIIESPLVVKGWLEDWSKCRSPGRARRRHRLGHRQHVARSAVPGDPVLSPDGGSIIMHPLTAEALRSRLRASAEEARFVRLVPGEIGYQP